MNAWRAAWMVPALVVGGVHAAEVIMLADPTRPPNVVLRQQQAMGSPGGAAMPLAPEAASAPASAAKRPPRLSAVRISAELGHVALIDGRLVSVGDRVGDAQVVSMDTEGVMLRGPKGLQRLWLMPMATRGMDDGVPSGRRAGKEER